jgi:hypothetical protein
MARHRKRPVSRHQAPGPDGGPAVPEAPDGRLSSAMRRVVVTPTFAAGLGVVVAAVLAYPVQTVFSYVAPGAAGGGLQCGQGGCSHQSAPAGKPAPFGVGGGVLSPPPPAAAKPAGNNGPPAPAGQQTGTGGTTVARPHLSYKITSKWQGGFWGQITQVLRRNANWHLRSAIRAATSGHETTASRRTGMPRWCGPATTGRLGDGRADLRGRRRRPGSTDSPGQVLVRRQGLSHRLAAPCAARQPAGAAAQGRVSG